MRLIHLLVLQKKHGFNPLTQVRSPLYILVLLIYFCRAKSAVYEAELKREERERHPINQREKHTLYPVSKQIILMFPFKVIDFALVLFLPIQLCEKFLALGSYEA